MNRLPILFRTAKNMTSLFGTASYGGLSAISSQSRIRYVGWYLHHGCNLDCFYCKVPKQKIHNMNRAEAVDALTRLYAFCTKRPILSITGGEPTLNADRLTESIEDATKIGYLVQLVSNGARLFPGTIRNLRAAGLQYLALSIDIEEETRKPGINQALQILEEAIGAGLVATANIVISQDTDIKCLRKSVQDIVKSNKFVNVLICSPEVPHGSFSGALHGNVPNSEIIHNLVPWLLWKKVTTGRIMCSFTYLLTLHKLTSGSRSQLRLWHCSPNSLKSPRRHSRGYVTLDSDGYFGPCQEFPRIVNILDSSHETLTQCFTTDTFSMATEKCPGCLYNCYINAEKIRGIVGLLEVAANYKLIPSVFLNRRS
jgi:MoaA/NifB/PqqE/SkfB family radical SAM enzyme